MLQSKSKLSCLYFLPVNIKGSERTYSMVGMALYYWHGSGWPLITFWIHRNSRNRFLFFQFKSSLNIAALLIELKCSFKINASCSIPWCPCCSNVPAKITSFLREVPFKEKHSENQIPSLCTLDPTNVAGRLTAKYNHLYTMVRMYQGPYTLNRCMHYFNYYKFEQISSHRNLPENSKQRVSLSNRLKACSTYKA